MNLKLQVIVFCFFCAVTPTLYAQQDCGSESVNKRLEQSNPAFKQIQKDFNTQMSLMQKGKIPRPLGIDNGVYEIPVVIHVIHTGDAIGTAYNPTDVQLMDMIDYLNKVYAADISVTAFSKPFNMKFTLAKRSPTCQPTTGIIRVDGRVLPKYEQYGVNYDNTNGEDQRGVKALSIWPASDYYNIWIVNKIDGDNGSWAGYAYYPGAPADIDGTIMRAAYARPGVATLPHEIGHAFNLAHTFNGSSGPGICPVNNDCSIDGDGVCDTDPQDARHSQHTQNDCGGLDVLRNIMSYSDLPEKFTQGQVDRALAALTILRSGLIASNGAIAPTPPTICANGINFETGADNVIETTNGTSDCRGYKDYTYNLVCGPAPTQAVTATLIPDVSSTALPGIDYDITTNGSFTSPSTSVVFSSASDQKIPFTVRIYDDRTIEVPKKIVLKFSLNNTGSTIGTAFPKLSIVINDDDNAVAGIITGTADIGTNQFYMQEKFSCFSAGTLTRHRAQYLYLASELRDAGIPAGATLTSLKYYFYRHHSTNPFIGFNVSMGQTASTSLSGYVSTPTTVYSGNYTTDPGATTTVPFTANNFNWDGTSNIVINICYDNGGAMGATDSLWGSQIPGVPTAAILSDVTQTGGSNGCSLPQYWNLSVRPKISFDYKILSGIAIETALNSSQTEYLGPNAEVYFKDAGGKLLARIKNLTSHDYGCTKVEIDRAGNASSLFWNNVAANYLATKTFKVIPTNNSTTGSYEISLYYSKAEIDGWKTATGKTLSDPGARMVKISNPVKFISDVSPATPYISDITASNIVTNSFGIDSAVTATYSNTSFSGFGIGIPGAPSSNPLPVALLSFEGYKHNKGVLLNWTTTSEINNDHFDIETSKDGSLFYKIAETKGNGRTDIQQKYSFVDNAPVEGNNYYRLKQVDGDGKFTYSKIVFVEFEGTLQQITVFPNPVKDKEELNIRFAQPEKNSTLRVVSIDGRVVLIKNVGAAQQTESINVSALARGIYILEIISTDRQTTRFRFVKE